MHCVCDSSWQGLCFSTDDTVGCWPAFPSCHLRHSRQGSVSQRLFLIPGEECAINRGGVLICCLPWSFDLSLTTRIPFLRDGAGRGGWGVVGETHPQRRLRPPRVMIRAVSFTRTYEVGAERGYHDGTTTRTYDRIPRKRLEKNSLNKGNKTTTQQQSSCSYTAAAVTRLPEAFPPRCTHYYSSHYNCYFHTSTSTSSTPLSDGTVGYTYLLCSSSRWLLRCCCVM